MTKKSKAGGAALLSKAAPLIRMLPQTGEQSFGASSRFLLKVGFGGLLGKATQGLVSLPTSDMLQHLEGTQYLQYFG